MTGGQGWEPLPEQGSRGGPTASAPGTAGPSTGSSGIGGHRGPHDDAAHRTTAELAPTRLSREELQRRVSEASPFARLARTHALMAAGDAAVAIALAGSLFFDVSPQAARWKVAAYLLFSLAPFAVVAPLVGPAIDRAPGGRRLAVIVIGLARAVVCLLMAVHVQSWLLFPEAFLFLVLQKSYAVCRAALVPSTVSSEDELVEANSKLGLIAGLIAVVGGVPALLFQLISPSGPLYFASLLFLVASLSAVTLNRDVIASKPADTAEKTELAAASILIAASAMGFLRASVGFLTFEVAFWFRRESVPTVWFGAVLGASVVATMIGNAVAGSIRAGMREERMIVFALGLVAVTGLLAAWLGGRISAVILAAFLGFSAAVARLAFDSIVQRDAPDANRGRAFARFETRFQLAWVFAAAIPVVIAIPPSVGLFLVAVISGSAAVSYVLTMVRVSRGAPVPTPLTDRLVSSASQNVKRRLRKPKRLPPPTVDGTAATTISEPTDDTTGGALPPPAAPLPPPSAPPTEP